MLERKKLAKVELYGTAALSMADMATDLYMMRRYGSQEESGDFAWATGICVLTSLLLQALVVFAQNRKQPLLKQVMEQAIVWSCVKPGIDAYRVVTEKSAEEGQISSLLGEMTVIKAIELFSESIPGTCVQMFALLLGGQPLSGSTNDSSAMPLISLSCSILTSAVISTSISYEYDFDPKNRAWSPNFYGYMPNGLRRRIACLLLLLFTSAFNLSVRAFTTLIFFSMGGAKLVCLVLGAEILLYLGVKALRKDMAYHIQVYGLFGMFMSVMFRLIAKIITDWTAVAHFRHPTDVGGAYWSFTLFLNVMLGLVAALIFDATAGGEGTDDGQRTYLDDIDVLSVMTALCFGLSTSFLLFLMFIEKKYVATFVSTKTSSAHIISKFLENDSDQLKFKILQRNELKWRAAIGPQVKTWIAERLPKWLDEKPEWFTNHKRSCVPDWAVDDPKLLVKLRTKKVKDILSERRKSVVAALGGAATGKLLK